MLTDLASLDDDQVRLMLMDLAFLGFRSIIGLRIARSPLTSQAVSPDLAARGLCRAMCAPAYRALEACR